LKPTVSESLKPKHDIVNLSDICLRTGLKCGLGFYFSQFIDETLYSDFFTYHGKEHRLVLQCRINPDAIRIPRQMDKYWLVNESIDIRPYGILVMQRELPIEKNECKLF